MDQPALPMNDKDGDDGSYLKNKMISRIDDRTGRDHQTVDAAGVIR